MTTPKEARAALADALTTVDGVRYYADLAATVDPPGTIVSPPALSWESHCADPTEAQFVVYLITNANERAVDVALDLLPTVTDAIETVPDAVVTAAIPGVWTAGTNDLPSYEITVEVSL